MADKARTTNSNWILSHQVRHLYFLRGDRLHRLETLYSRVLQGHKSNRESLEKLVGKDYVDAGWRKSAADANSLAQTWLGQPYRWWFDVMDIDPVADYLSLDIPIMIAQGEQDQSVPIESSRSLESDFEAAGKTNLSLRTFPGADHSLSSGQHSYRQELFEELSRTFK